MSEIAELERRIAAALARIEAGVERLGAAPAPAASAPREGAPREGEEIARLAEALEAERAANAQLAERVRAVKEKQEAMVGALERKVERLTAELDAAQAEIQRLKRLSDELIETNRALTAAAAAGLVDPDLVNRALMNELQALRGQRAAEIAEMEGILAELKPLIGEVA